MAGVLTVSLNFSANIDRDIPAFRGKFLQRPSTGGIIVHRIQP